MKRIAILLIILFSHGLIFHSSAQKADIDQAIRKLNMATVLTNLYYVDSVSINRQVEDAINGMLSKLDPH